MSTAEADKYYNHMLTMLQRSTPKNSKKHNTEALVNVIAWDQ